MSEARPAAPPVASTGDGNAGDDDSGGGDLVPGQWQLFKERDASGAFVSDIRCRRKPQAFPIPIIILHVEPAEGIDTEPPGSSSSTPPDTRTWLIRGPVRGYPDDAWRLSTLATVTAASSMPPHEVYVRSMTWLVPGTNVDVEDAHASIRAVFLARWPSEKHWDETTATSSFATVRQHDSLSDEDVEEVLRPASANVRTSCKCISEGFVVLEHRRNAIDDPVNRKGVAALLRQRSIRALRAFRNRGAAYMRARWNQMIRAMGAGAVAGIRRILELDPSQPSRGTGEGSTRIRLSMGKTQMHFLTSRAELREVRSTEFDRASRVQHFFCTRPLLPLPPPSVAG